MNPNFVFDQNLEDVLNESDIEGLSYACRNHGQLDDVADEVILLYVVAGWNEKSEQQVKEICEAYDETYFIDKHK